MEEYLVGTHATFIGTSSIFFKEDLSKNIKSWQLIKFFSSPGLVAHSDLDERAIEALKEFNEDGALAVLQQFKDSDLSHVQVILI